MATTSQYERRDGHDGGDPAPGAKRAALSSRIREITEKCTGRAPSAVETAMTSELVTVTIHDPLTASEQALKDAGGERGVIELRDEMRSSLQGEVVAAVEAETGRAVEAFLLAHHLDPDVTVQTFLLSPGGA